ncbi:splicing factor 3A subunit 3 [Nannochloropsis gaditana CCMP526]|uniref:splicing factor 3A subunit 3 n=1 Tax=Nannochloropsis gaditana (strain CCMP526) TaxID=1093141 RepID=UPI00029F6063|nr:splicing factor 3A subunit 3 [Nannochloropsis gaditana CCMP526]EKU22951.1 splicing factor 3A subunit 3 [Nannochloropsis gaditana CCMP526]|eukprot:XP_005853408.1 splicing factor 3A subunit 3 [Nannochloropsis gaditana CCMP526]
MSGLTLERARANHEDIEAYEAAIVAILEDKPRTAKERVWQQHRVSNLIEQIQGRSKDLEGIYEDVHGTMKEELATLRGRDAFPSFYARVDHAKEYHQKHPDVPVKHHPPVQEEAEPRVSFSGEEVFGKYLDLQASHMEFYALPQTPKWDYQTYLSRLADFSVVPAGKKNAAWARYVHNLYNYLHSFIQRTQPLLNVEEILDGNVDGGEEGATKKAEAAFEALWQAGKLPGGWPVPAQGGGEEKGAENTKEVDLRGFRTAKELEVLGMDRLKAGLKALGMKCGGTLEERAARLFATKGKKKEEIDPKLLAGNGKKKSKAEGNGPTSNGNGQGVGTDKEGGKGGEDGKKQCARWEFRIDLLVKEVLREVVEATKKFVEKKQTRTKEETETELRQEEEGLLPELRGEGEEEDEDEEEEEDEDGPIYNPLNLPLGYDGKPIPYWLYKLHGLGVEYKCEICGNHSYWGRRAFDRHFQEWRHAHGMRCLKIPNTKHFHDITTIKDALALYDRIKEQLKGEVYDAEVEEEFEDSEGNVLNRRTFQDLARQGLL